MPSPTSLSGQRIYLSICDLVWALTSPLIALYLRDAEILYRGDWTQVAYYTGMSAGFALIAFLVLRIQDGMRWIVDRRLYQSPAVRAVLQWGFGSGSLEMAKSVS